MTFVQVLLYLVGGTICGLGIVAAIFLVALLFGPSYHSPRFEKCAQCGLVYRADEPHYCMKGNKWR